LGGTIAFRNFVYATKNSCIRIVDGSVALRWWFAVVRESVDGKKREREKKKMKKK